MSRSSKKGPWVEERLMQRKGLAALAVITVVVGLAAWGLRARSLPAAEALPEPEIVAVAPVEFGVGVQ